jgi:hypothetical protein
VADPVTGDEPMDVQQRIRKAMAKVLKLDLRLEEVDKRAREVSARRATADGDGGPAASPVASARVVDVWSDGNADADADADAIVPYAPPETTPARSSARKAGGAAAAAGGDVDAADESGATPSARRDKGHSKASKNFVSRNVELAGKVKHKHFTKEEETRLRELIGAELMGDDDATDGDKDKDKDKGPAKDSESPRPSARAAVDGDGDGAVTARQAALVDAVADADAALRDGELPVALRQPCFAPTGLELARLRAVEGQLQAMVTAGTACDAACDPYPRPLKLFPVFLTALESRVSVRDCCAMA